MAFWQTPKGGIEILPEPTWAEFREWQRMLLLIDRARGFPAGLGRLR